MEAQFKSRWKSKFAKANIVGTVHTVEGLALVSNLSKNELALMLDVIEVRLDVMHPLPKSSPLQRLTSAPVLITARDPLEGGVNNLSLGARRKLIEAGFPFANALDIELRNMHLFYELIEVAKQSGIVRVFSFHNFVKTPPLKELLEKHKIAFEHGASIFKIATYLNSGKDLATLLEFLDSVEQPVAVMGMGPLGRASRIALAACGSCLNYGWIDRPQVEGQFSAMMLKRRVQEVISEEQAMSATKGKKKGK